MLEIKIRYKKDRKIQKFTGRYRKDRYTKLHVQKRQIQIITDAEKTDPRNYTDVEKTDTRKYTNRQNTHKKLKVQKR